MCREKRLEGFTMCVNREVTSGEGLGDFYFLQRIWVAFVIRTKYYKTRPHHAHLRVCSRRWGAEPQPLGSPAPDFPLPSVFFPALLSVPFLHPLFCGHRFFHPSEKRLRERKEHLWINEQSPAAGVRGGPRAAHLSLPRT